MILARYLVTEFLKRFFVFLFILVILFLGIDLLSRIWSVEASFKFISLYYFFRIPDVMVQMIPVSTLLATLMLFSELSKHNELVSLYCSGRSILKIALPVFITVSLISFASFYISDRVLPSSNFYAQKTWMTEILKRHAEFYDTLHQKKAWFREKNLIYNIGSYDSSTFTASGLNLYYFNDNFDPVSHIHANKAIFNDKTSSWLLEDVKHTSFSSGRAVTVHKERMELALRQGPDEFKSIEAKSTYLNVSSLGRYVEELKMAGLSPAKYSVELNKRYSMAFAGLIMCLIGLPFAIKQHRRGGVALNIGLGFGLVFVYWVLFSLLLSLGISGRLYAPLSAWGANLIFAFASIVLLKLSKK